MGEVESHLEVMPQELGLQNSPSGPGEPLSHVVKEESDTEQELGEYSYSWSDTEQELGGYSYSWWCVVLFWRNLGIVVSRPKRELKMIMLPRLESF